MRDLLYILPVRYENYTVVSPCSTRGEGDILVEGTITGSPKLTVFHGIRRVNATIADESGKLSICWYNSPWMMNNIHDGDKLRLYGRLSVKNNRRILNNPKLIDKNEAIAPVYRSVRGFSSGVFRKLIQEALKNVDDCCPETLPADFRIRYHLCELNFAIHQAHFPSNADNLEIARRRLSFEKALMYMLYISVNRKRKEESFPFTYSPGSLQDFYQVLPYQPTDAQKRVLNEIAADLKKDSSMSRLVQGDVGCGKTLVAFGAIYLSFSSGYQASMMAPTEILATQHYDTARKILEPLGLRCRLLTGSTRQKERKLILDELKNQQCHAVFGTQALISKDVEYARLGLVITDEQHRFGVKQRSSLQNKGKSGSIVPHVLVMSATPIPRTLSLILYGDLDLSVIDEMPKGRKPVRTRLVPENKRNDMYQFLRREVLKGRQAYIVCPLVDQSENESELHSAKSLFSSLQKNELSGLHIALTWGSQKTDEKNRVLRGFIDRQFDVLVSTTVIEVGVNNPNATIMIVENAERYGLSQLHQLRGRVGRGSEESWCFLLSETTEKLRILCESNDGFVISQKDLEQRGPGDIIGTRQSGDAGIDGLNIELSILDEVTRCIHEMNRDPSMHDSLSILERLAFQYFCEKGQKIALN